MIKKIIAVLLTFTLLFSVSACQKKTKYSAEFLTLFDTVTQIIGYSESEAEFTKFAESIHDNLKEYHELYDIYNSYEGINNIKTINDNAGIAPVKVDRRIIDLLIEAKEMYELSNGKFNVAFGAVLKIWHVYRTEGLDDPINAALPPMDQLKAAAKHIDINNLIIDEAASTVYLTDPEMSLDVGGIGKGYATEQVCLKAQQNGATSVLISVGGNVRAIGNKGVDDNAKWTVGIQNPDTESEQTTLHNLMIEDLSVVSSGVYERYYTVDGKNYHHIIDPATLMPTNSFRAVTIVCKDSGIADCLSTAVFNMTYEEGLAFINGLSDTEAVWVMPDGEIRYSEGYEKLIKKEQ